MIRKLLARLLHLANSDPPFNRREFYNLKDRLLRKYGTFHGHDLQIITKECWGERHYFDDDSYDFVQEPCGPQCRRCGGTGIFDQRWVRLERWQWGKYLFHIPAGDTRKKPDSPPESWIKGVIKHQDYGRLSNEACLWLYLLCGEWDLFWRTMKGSCCCGWYLWPLLNLQRLTMNLCMRLRWKMCGCCGRRFPTWGIGWQWCRKCRNKPQEIPF
ncbi:MAG: hypothetical protein KGJ09_09290 [Candidatus Omnitrophica bacterium]|nr:hypothetical protein [Candidatus Omnitrophota bacterium]